MQKLGILVVGQSPRPEVEAEFSRLLGNTEIIQRGCLDGLSREEISNLTPQNGEKSLFTRLPNGDGVSLSKAAVVSRGTRQLDALESLGAKAVVVLCTGEFPQWSNRRVLMPSNIIRSFVTALRPSGHLGILSPLEEQIPATQERWSTDEHRVSVFALSPNASIQDAEAVGGRFLEDPPDLIVFDCVSYTRKTKQALCTSVGRPGVLAITAIARTAAELLE